MKKENIYNFVGMKKGFTLIELLVVISIIGILAAFSYVSFLSSQMTARDTQRRSDLNQYKIKLEIYANGVGVGNYPTGYTTAAVIGSSLCTTLTMSPCLADPLTGTGYDYYYADDAADSGSTYKMFAKLESAAGYWEVCSEGKSGFVPTASWTNDGTCNL